MKSINFKAIETAKPFIFHNAWNLDEHKLTLFFNREMPKQADQKAKQYKVPIDARSLCACSALPFVEETVEIDKVTYCEGALVDTVNFESLLQEHHNPPNDTLDEIWVSRIVDSKQVRKPKDLHDALANLCQLFAATVGEDDVRIFKYHVQYDEPKWEGVVVEIQVPGHISFKWNHSNLYNGRELGRAAAEQAIKRYHAHADLDPHDGPHFINQHPEKNDKEGWQKVKDMYHRCQERADT
ncbi:hypothetical protein [Bradyrhizobium australafricanum]|uniref:hypothetical protein n=1 Tax=Bradyrhizobium australafricanum TaxID=2821406 RepID=UPI001CE30C9B|nr:hypothetical protein [Bradyrhizobium australafricanum]MCA6104938.1 hypothetical protein [Bradyrhizobium australafricanum]